MNEWDEQRAVNASWSKHLLQAADTQWSTPVRVRHRLGSSQGREDLVLYPGIGAWAIGGGPLKVGTMTGSGVTKFSTLRR